MKASNTQPARPQLCSSSICSLRPSTAVNHCAQHTPRRAPLAVAASVAAAAWCATPPASPAAVAASYAATAATASSSVTAGQSHGGSLSATERHNRQDAARRSVKTTGSATWKLCMQCTPCATHRPTSLPPAAGAAAAGPLAGAAAARAPALQKWEHGGGRSCTQLLLSHSAHCAPALRPRSHRGMQAAAHRAAAPEQAGRGPGLGGAAAARQRALRSGVRRPAQQLEAVVGALPAAAAPAVQCRAGDHSCMPQLSLLPLCRPTELALAHLRPAPAAPAGPARPAPARRCGWACTRSCWPPPAGSWRACSMAERRAALEVRSGAGV